MSPETLRFLQGLCVGLSVGIGTTGAVMAFHHLRRVRELCAEFRRILHEPTP